MTVNSTITRLNQRTAPIDLGHEARLWLIPGILGDAATALFHTLCNQLPWDRPRVRVFGREHQVPRLTCWVADQGISYRYSGLTHECRGWPPALDGLRREIGELEVELDTLVRRAHHASLVKDWAERQSALLGDVETAQKEAKAARAAGKLVDPRDKFAAIFAVDPDPEVWLCAGDAAAPRLCPGAAAAAAAPQQRRKKLVKLALAEKTRR